MTEKLSIHGLKLYIKHNKITRVVFNSDNQYDYEPCAYPKYVLEFDRMEVFENPSVILVSGCAGKVQFGKISGITADDTSSFLGTILSFYSGGKKYTALIS